MLFKLCKLLVLALISLSLKLEKIIRDFESLVESLQGNCVSPLKATTDKTLSKLSDACPPDRSSVASNPVYHVIVLPELARWTCRRLRDVSGGCYCWVECNRKKDPGKGSCG